MAIVNLTPEAQKQADGLPVRIAGRFAEVVQRLEKWPEVSGAKPLRRELMGNFRLRIGDWRVLFRVEGHVVTIWKIDNRRDVYED